MSLLSRIFHRTKTTSLSRDKTHQVLNDIQRTKLRVDRQDRENKRYIIDTLSKSNDELQSVAQNIATATGASERGFK